MKYSRFTDRRLSFFGLFRVCLFVALLWQTAAVYGRDIIIGSSFKERVISREAAYLEDRKLSLGLEAVLRVENSARFIPVDKDTINFGFTRSAYWIRFIIKNELKRSIRCYLQVSYPMLDDVRFYFPTAGGYGEVIAGDRFPYLHRTVDDENHVFELELPPDAGTYYLRVQSSTAVHVPLKLIEERHYFKSAATKNVLNILLYGCLAVLIVICFFIFIFSRDKIYVYYCGLIIVLSLMLLSFDGLGFRYLWPAHPPLNNTIFWIFITNVAIALFTREFLRFIDPNRGKDAALLLFGAFALLLAIASLFYEGLGTTGTIFTIMGSVLSISVSVPYIRTKRLPITLFLTSWFFFMSGAIGRGLNAIGLFHSIDSGENYFRASILVQSLLFSLSIAAQINSLKRELEREVDLHKEARRKLVHNYSELEATNEELMATVEELEATNEEFERQYDELSATQKELENSEEKFSKAFKNSPVIIGISRLSDGTYIDVNAAFETILGYSREETIGYTSTNLGIFPDPSLRERLLPLLKDDGSIVNTELIFRTKHGELRSGLFSAEIIEIAGDRCLIATVIDITDRKNAENSLATEHERLEVTLRSIGDGVIATDSDRNVVLINRVAEELTGWTSSEVSGKPLNGMFSLLDRKTGDDCVGPVEILLQTGLDTDIRGESILITRDGTERIIESSAATIRDWNGQMIGLVIVFRDISGKTMMERELQTIEKLKAVTIVAAGIAHDFNNLLTAILGNINIAKMHTAGRYDLHSFLNEAEKACLRATGLTQQMLSFSKGGAPVKKTISIRELIEDTALFAMSGSTVASEFRFPGDLWSVDVDPVQLSQVIQNLVINAVQSMPSGGSLVIAAENRVVNDLDHLPLAVGSYVKIMVKDSGCGMDQKTQSKIFDPFFTTKATGSGLGLTNSYLIVGNHKGHMTLESEPGKGTRFYIYLPATSGERSVAISRTNEKYGAGKHILIMEDESIVINTIRKMFEFIGCTVDIEQDCDQTIARYRESIEKNIPYDLVLLDLTIPGGRGGVETLRELFKINPSVMAIVSSGYSNDPVMARYEEYGFRGVLRKPYRIEEIHEMLRELFASSTQ